MRAALFHEYGPPEVLKAAEVPDVHPGPGEVRIRVRAAGVNPADTKIRRGLFQQRLPHVLPIIPGWDVAGIIDEVGEGAERLSVGDAVFSYCRKPVVQFGAYAEYLVFGEEHIALKPARATFEEAASIPLSALTAWQCLNGAAALSSGQTVLIHAGAGGVGGFAIQLAKLAGAYVLSTGSGGNHEYLRQLGADMVIDYTKVDFRDAVLASFPHGIDVVYDTVGEDVQVRSADVVKKGGILVSILAFRDEAAIQRKQVQTRYVFVSPNREQLAHLAGLFDDGKLKTRVTDVLPLEAAAEAHRRIETRHTAGKIVLAV